LDATPGLKKHVRYGVELKPFCKINIESNSGFSIKPLEEVLEPCIMPLISQ
jgi:hypothetical protein